MSKKRKANKTTIALPAPAPLSNRYDAGFWTGIGITLALSLAAFCLHFGYQGGLRMADPRNIGWIYSWSTDVLQQFTTWSAFLYEKWQFPVGKITSVFYPVGTTLAAADAIPLLAVPVKALGIAVPGHFQYFGFWYLACYLLQAAFAYLLTGTMTRNRILQVLGSAFFVFSPVLLFRDHPSLNAHWLILGSLWLYFDDGSKRFPTRAIALQAVFVWLSFLIHPYLTAMIIALAGAFFIRLYFFDRAIPGRSFLLSIAATMLLLAFTGYLLGLFPSHTSSRSWGYGYVSMNLNSPFNAMGGSAIFDDPPLPQTEQSEGYSYLGAGVMLLFLYAAFLKLAGRNRFKENPEPSPSVRLTPLAVVSVGMLLFALSNIIYLNKEIVFQYGKNIVYDYQEGGVLTAIASTFRASGRFVWIPYYVLFYLLLRTILRKRPVRTAIAIFSVALAVQLYDISPLLTRYTTVFYFEQFLPVRHRFPSDAVWAQGLKGYKKIVLFIPSLNFERFGDFMAFTYFAVSRHMVTNAGGYAGRLPDFGKQYYQTLAYSIASGTADKDTAYVVQQAYVPQLYRSLNRFFNCYLLDGYLICCPRDRETPPALKPYRVMIALADGKAVYQRVPGEEK